MRKNYFGESYCHTEDEIAHELEKVAGGVSCGLIDPPEGDDKACGHVMDDDTGGVQFYVEADTVEAVEALLEKAGIEINI